MANAPDESESVKILKDIRRFIIALVLFGIFALLVWGVIARQNESMDASRRQGERLMHGGR